MTNNGNATEVIEATSWYLFPLKSRSKEPITGWKWKNKVTNDLTELNTWFQEYQDSNWAIVTGAKSGIVVLDVDKKNGGLETLMQLEAQNGPLPDTPTVKTGGGGYHYYFKHPGGRIGCRNGVCPGIDIKGDGGYVVAPGSIHESGAEYTWTKGFSPSEVETAELPEWIPALSSFSKNSESEAGVKPSSEIVEGERDSRLFVEGRRLASMGWTEDLIYEALKSRNLRDCSPPLSDQQVRKLSQQATKYVNQTEDRLGVTDADNARRLIRRHGSTIRYLREKKSGRWYVYTGSLWDDNPSAETLVLQKAEETARSIADEAVLEPDQKKTQDLLRHASNSLNRSRFVAMVEQSKHQPEIATSIDDFNASDHLINMDNGTYDLVEHQLLDHKSRDMITKSVGYNYDPDANCPRWEQFMDEIFDGDQDLMAWMQCVLGLSLTGYAEHQFSVFMTGSGSNGKSVLLESMMRLLGGYGRKCNSALFKATTNDNEKGYILDGLRDIRFSYASELNEGEYLAAATLKEVTGGEEVSCRTMYLGYTKMIPKMKLFMATNTLPRIDELNHGTWRRIKVVPFHQEFKPASEAGSGDRVRDDGLLKYLCNSELPGIFNWCVAGLQKLQANKMQLPSCAAISAATAAYKQDEDMLAEWLDEHCTITPGASNGTSDLLESFRDRSGYKNISAKRFKKMMEAHGFRAAKSNGKRVYKGLRLKIYFPKPTS